MWPVLQFDFFQQHKLSHAFTLRHELQNDAQWFEAEMERLGFPQSHRVAGTQPHSHFVARVSSKDGGMVIPEVDALVTNELNLTLVIRTADCGPIFLYDPQHHAIGLAHSGRKGTEQNILLQTVQTMQREFGSNPSSLIGVLAPCIRVPDYDVDFASEIVQQAKDAGIHEFHDCGLNTASDLSRFYSYRAEKGKTGRHYSLLKLL